ncbi:hypothetical protein BSQ39_09565 [Loigolactobacillus backii]|nr:hypothetical protein BSQ39_09565 [Loigolactobacillus backii]
MYNVLIKIRNGEGGYDEWLRAYFQTIPRVNEDIFSHACFFKVDRVAIISNTARELGTAAFILVSRINGKTYGELNENDFNFDHE